MTDQLQTCRVCGAEFQVGDLMDDNWEHPAHIDCLASLNDMRLLEQQKRQDEMEH